MNAPVTRRRLVAGAAVALGAAALPAGIAEALTAEAPPVFNPVGFLTDLRSAGCRVCLALPATVFRPEDVRPTYFVSWPPQTGAFKGYCAVMSKWSDAMAACPDHVDLVTARLVEMRGVEL